MRTISPEAIDALKLEGHRASARLTIYNSRVYFDTIADDGESIVFAPPAGYTGNPVPEAISWNGNIECAVAVAVNAGKVYLMRDGRDGALEITYLTNPLIASNFSRPGILGNKIFYYDGSNWKKATIDMDAFNINNPECVTNLVTYTGSAGIEEGAIHLLAGNDEQNTYQSVILHLHEGAIRVTYIDEDGGAHHCPGRFFHPTEVMVADVDDEETPIGEEYLFDLHYSAAARLGNTICVYYTNHKGAVQVLRYFLDPADTEDEIGVWSDVELAIQEDISAFACANAFVSGGRIFLVGQFSREEDFTTSIKSTLILWSTDGLTFSFDRRVLCSLLKYRFLVCMGDNHLYFGATNRNYYVAIPPYQFIGESTTSYIMELRTVEGNPTSGFSADTIAGNEPWVSHSTGEPLTDATVTNRIVGDYAKLELGMLVEGTMEYVKYHDVIVAGASAVYEDGLRSLQLNLVADAIWHNSMMTYPFYMEVLGKQVVFDPCKNHSNLDGNSVDAGAQWTLSCDLWSEEEVSSIGMEAKSHAANTTTDVWSQDFEVLFTEYPIFGATETYEVRLYGWSRAGLPSTNPNTPDPTNPATPNDDVYALLLVEDENGDQTTVVSLIGELTSVHEYFEQTWFVAGEREGSYPIIYAIANPGAGKKIIKLGMRFISSVTGPTVFLPERVEVPGIIVTMSADEDEEAWEIKKVATPRGGFYVKWLYPGDGSYEEYEFPDELKTTFTYHTTIEPTGNGSEGMMGIDIDVVEDDITTRLHSTIRNELVLSGAPDLETDVLTNNHGGGGGGAYDFYLEDLQVGINLLTEEVTRSVVGMRYEEPDNGYYAHIDIGDDDLGKIISVDRTITIEVTSEEEQETELKTTYKMINKRKGIQLLKSNRPYVAWNFDIIACMTFKGPYTSCGCAGLITTDHDFLAGYIRKGYYGVAKVRDGRVTVLEEYEDASIVEDVQYDVRFWHRDGWLGLEYKLTAEDWPVRGSKVLHKWAEVDGAISIGTDVAKTDIHIDDIFNVGIYSNIDTPRFRITGFNSTSKCVGVMPLDMNPVTGISDFADDAKFPHSGRVSIDGKVYTYTSKYDDMNEEYPIKGPYQLRNVTSWAAYTGYEGGSYNNGQAVEFLLFTWWGCDHVGEFQNKIIANSNGFAWLNDESDFMVWITTGGKKVLLLNRSRHFSDEMATSIPTASMADRIWVTNGLIGMAPAEAGKGVGTHLPGTFAYMDSEDEVDLFGFFAASGLPDYSVANMLDIFCKTSGTAAEFPGDHVIDSHLFAENEELEI